MTPSESTLDTIYAELARLNEGASCPRSGRCCRFRETGRVPYVWPVEANRVLRAIGRRGGRMPRGAGEENCPLLLPDGGCSIYADRPFGCRTFFCDDAVLPPGRRRQAIERLARELRAAAEGEGELLPLTTHLDRAFSRGGRRRAAR